MKATPTNSFLIYSTLFYYFLLSLGIACSTPDKRRKLTMRDKCLQQRRRVKRVVEIWAVCCLSSLHFSVTMHLLRLTLFTSTVSYLSVCVLRTIPQPLCPSRHVPTVCWLFIVLQICLSGGKMLHSSFQCLYPQNCEVIVYMFLSSQAKKPDSVVSPICLPQMNLNSLQVFLRHRIDENGT